MPYSSDLGQQVIIAASLLARSYRRQADLALASCGLSEVMAWPVLVVGRRDGLRQIELAELLGIEGPSLVRNLDRVEAAGFIERRADPSDRRAKTLHLTQAGRALSLRIETVLADLSQRTFDGIPAADLHTCLAVFGQVDAALARGSQGAPT